MGNSDLIFKPPTSQHPWSNYGTLTLNNAINGIIYQYKTEYCADPRYQKVAINDMALPFGGVFDVNLNFNPPHYTHSHGATVDIRCKPAANNSVIWDQAVINRFLRIANDKGLYYSILENSNDMNVVHCHCSTDANGIGY